MITEEVMDRLRILTDVAKFDASCASSGVNRNGGGKGTMGSSLSCGICHSFTEDGRCISLLKLLQSNDCVFDCKYCINRRTADIERTSLTSEEVAELTFEFYRRNYIEGLFLSSAVRRSPDDTMTDMIETIRLLREKYGFYGYIHCKTIPGASPELIELAGRYADRISVNIELPSEQSLSKLAPQKKKDAILGPMKYIAGRIEEDKTGRKGKLLTSAGGGITVYSKSSGTSVTADDKYSSYLENRGDTYGSLVRRGADLSSMPASYGTGSNRARRFAPGGQSTQMIVGASDDTDLKIISLTEAFYRKMALKRVYYSAFVPVNNDPSLPAIGTPPPLLREHRLYQADWLLRFYGFQAGELLDEKKPNLDIEMDPKCDWALRHQELFPVEVNRADYEMLLRVPGIGVTSAKRIVRARRVASLGFEELKRMGIVLKRAKYFITCRGRIFERFDMNADIIGQKLADRYALAGIGITEGTGKDVEANRRSVTRLSLFDTELVPAGRADHVV